MFERTFAMFTPFARERRGRDRAEEAGKPAARGGGDEIDDLKRQLDEMQKRLDKLGGKE